MIISPLLHAKLLSHRRKILRIIELLAVHAQLLQIIIKMDRIAFLAIHNFLLEYLSQAVLLAVQVMASIREQSNAFTVLE